MSVKFDDWFKTYRVERFKKECAMCSDLYHGAYAYHLDIMPKIIKSIEHTDTQEKIIIVLEKQNAEQKEVIKLLGEMGEFYGDIKSWSTTKILFNGFAEKTTLKYDSNDSDFNEYAGKKARETLSNKLVKKYLEK